MPDAGHAWTVIVDREVCMGSGMCIVYAPTKAVMIDPPGDAIEAVRTAVEACPTGALRLVLDDEEG